MSFVLDASVAVAWAFAGEAHPVASAALALIGSEEGRVPSLWWFEVRNVLIGNERRGRLRETDTAQFLRNLARLPIIVDRTPEEVSWHAAMASPSTTPLTSSWQSAPPRRLPPSTSHWGRRRSATTFRSSALKPHDPIRSTVVTGFPALAA